MGCFQLLPAARVLIVYVMAALLVYGGGAALLPWSAPVGLAVDVVGFRAGTPVSTSRL